MDETSKETEEIKIPIARPKRSSLKMSNPINIPGLTDLNSKKRHSVSFKMGTHFSIEKVKAKFENIDNLEKKENTEKKKKFMENRRQSVKNEFSLVKDLLKKKNMDEIEESDEDEEIKQNTKKNIEQGKQNLNDSLSSNSSSSSSKSNNSSNSNSSNSESEEKKKKKKSQKKINLNKKEKYIIESNNISFNYLMGSDNTINKDAYIKLKNEKENLESKLNKIKIIMEELKVKFDLEISKRDGKILTLKEQNDNFQTIINKYNNLQNNLKKEKNEIQSQLFKELKKNEQLNDKIEQLNQYIKLKNEQININNKYSIELISIVNNLKEKVDKDKNQRKQNQVVNNLNKEIQNLKKQLQTNKSMALGLEAKNKILENNYRTLSYSYNELKNLQEKEENNKNDFHFRFSSSPNLTKKKNNNNNKFNQYYTNFRNKNPIYLLDENNDKTKINYLKSYDNKNENENFLMSENVLPKIFSTSRSAKDYKSLKNYTQMDIFHTQHDISNINQMMSDIINDINN